MWFCEWCLKCRHILFITLKLCFAKDYQLDIITKYKNISPISKIIILAFPPPPPLNLSHHESPLIFLIAAIKPESAKPLITATESKVLSPLFTQGMGIFPGASAWCPWWTFWIWVTASLPLALLPQFQHLFYWELSANNKQVGSKDILLILLQQ